MTQQGSPQAQRTGNGKIVALCIAAGLLVGAGVMTPFVINYRNSMEKARTEVLEAAVRAEQARQEAVALEKQKGEMRENLGQAEKTIEALRVDLTARSTALEALKQTDAAKTKEVESLKADIQKKTAAMGELDDRLKGTLKDVEGATSHNAELAARVNTLRGEVSRLSETVQEQGAEMARLVEVTRQKEAEKQAALQAAESQRQRAEAAQIQARAAQVEIMTMAPIRIEERRATLKGRRIGEKSGVPFAAALDPIGDAFQGIGEGLFGKKGPVILVAVYKDGHEEMVTTTDANKWKERGIRVVKLGKA